uniref:TMC domain-containing protein n=1 Tax=Globodera rostochiensis TaxID=31243 RepID=A0A914GUK5_GLORO
MKGRVTARHQRAFDDGAKKVNGTGVALFLLRREWPYASGHTRVAIREWPYASGHTRVAIREWPYASGHTRVAIREWPDAMAREWPYASGHTRVAIREWPDASGQTRVAIREWPYASGHTRVAIREWPYASGHTRVAIREWPDASGQTRVARREWPDASGQTRVARRERGEEEEEEYDEQREETSVDAPAGLFSDAEEEGGVSPSGSSPRDFSSGHSSFHTRGEPRGQRTAAIAQQPPRGKFMKRSETAPRPSSASGVGYRLAEKRQRRPTSATPAYSEGEGPHSTMENLTSRLSRRSSIISDLVALMVRRSSSFGKGRHSDMKEQQDHEQKNEEDELEDEEETEEGEQDLGNMPREKILQKIRRHKEIIGKVRLQPWPMRRKRRALKVARQYLQRQEAQVSRWNLYKAELSRRCNQAWRWAKNLSIYLIPWESKIKQIESNFGSVVSSYFIFLRWVLGMNITTSFMMMAFVVVPEWLSDSQNDPWRFNRTRHIKVIPPKVLAHADELNTVLDFGGYLQFSYLFYGFYSSETVLKGVIIPYNVPVAYFCVNLFLLVFCIFIILKKMTSNARKSKLSSGKQEQYVFTWKVVNGWDYNLGESETASSLAMANVIKLKEASTEYNKKFKQKWTCQTFFLRVFVNFVIMSLIGLSMLAIWMAAQITEKDTFIKQNAVSITVALITLLFPPVFELILKLEQYRPRTALRIHLFRVLIFYLINYFTLVAGLFTQLNTLEGEMRTTSELNEWSRPKYGGDQWGPSPYGGSFQVRHSLVGNRTFYEVLSTAPGSDGSIRKRPFFIKGLPNVTRTKATGGGGARRRKRPSQEHGTETNVLYSSKPLEPTLAPGEVSKAWTTVQPHFGPFNVGVHNPKVIVASARNGPQATIYESRPIGPSDVWAATDVPKPLNYTSAPKTTRIFKQPYRASNYDDLCWETLIGQEIAKIVTTDLVMTVAAILVIDFIRGLWIRYCSDWWCWDIESTFPEYGEFKVAENVLHLVNSQGMVCLGTILVPMLPLINCVKLVLMMYIRAWACMVCNVPAKQIFRASRSSNFYFWLLLMMLCISTLPVGFVIASKEPSKNCGPFAGQKRFFGIIGAVLKRNLNQRVVDVISYLMSPGIVIPVLLLMFLVIYFLVLLVNGLRAANTDLNKQLTLERTEEKRKIFELAKGRRGNGSISHQYKPSGESGRSGANDGAERPSQNGAAQSTDPTRERMSPMYFLNGATKQALRKSWHGPSGEPEGILLNPLLHSKRQALQREYSDESSGSSQSPSKSPLRHTTFLPSLQSVHENEEDESPREGEEEDGDESPPPIGSQADLGQRPIRFSWKNRLLICIGWTDAKSVEERLRSQMEETADEEGEEEAVPLLGARTGDTFHRDEAVHHTPVLEEVDYSVSSNREEEEEEEEEEVEDKSSSRGAETVQALPSTSGRIGSRRVRLDSDNSEGISQSRRLAELGEPLSTTSIGSSARTDSQRSWVRKAAAEVDEKPEGAIGERKAMPLALPSPPLPFLFTSAFRNSRRISSVEKGNRIPSPVERGFVSESSPLSQHGPSPFPNEDLARLSPDKRHPLSPLASARARGHLPPLAPPPVLERSSRRRSRGSDGRLDTERCDNGDDYGSLDTRAPSEESFLLPCQPPTPVGHFRPIVVPAVLCEFADSDPRLQYANPYSSYAAAMCSPLSLSTELWAPSQQIAPVLPPPLEHFRRPFHSETVRIPPLPRHGSIAPFLSPSGSPSESVRQQMKTALGGYSTPIQKSGRRQKSKQKPEPIYDQPIDEGGSTSGRGTMPPGYGSSPRSSPESGRPKYRISSMSPGLSCCAPRMAGNDGSLPDWHYRHFDIRQRPSLGLGHPLSITASPRPQTTASPRPQTTASPRPQTTASPRPQTTASPRPQTTASPRPQMTASPWPQTTASPRPQTTASPRPQTTAFPRPQTTASPRPQTTVFPRPQTTASPRPQTTASPRPQTTAFPRPQTTASPRPQTTAFPRPQTTASPRPQTTASPRPQTTASPRPQTTASPRPQTTASPRPQTTASPRPQTTASPRPQTTASPRPQTTASPRPQTTASPRPQTTASPRPQTTTCPRLQAEEPFMEKQSTV